MGGGGRPFIIIIGVGFYILNSSDTALQVFDMGVSLVGVPPVINSIIGHQFGDQGVNPIVIGGGIQAKAWMSCILSVLPAMRLPE